MRKFIIFFLLATVLISCQTTRKEPVAIPDIDYPEFPADVDDPAVIVTLKDESVCIDYTAEWKQTEIPLWFWLKLVKYSIEVDSAINQYQAVINNINK